MKENNKSIISNNRKAAETMTYIVKGPIPKSGQTASSGGIRENGKLCAQYRDPVPYAGPSLPLADNQTYALAAQLKSDISFDIVSLLWYEFGKPLTESIFKFAAHKLTTRIINSYLPKQVIPRQVIEVVDEAVPQEAPDQSNIILFPSDRVG